MIKSADRYFLYKDTKFLKHAPLTLKIIPFYPLIKKSYRLHISFKKLYAFPQI
jgi:hypothetical protein